MRNVTRGTVVAGVALVITLVGTAVVGAQRNGEQQAHHGCTVATIKGTFGVQISGTRPSAPGGPIESVVGVLIRNYDGQGQFSQIDNVKGSISGIVPDRQGNGTYQVNENCTGIAQAQPGPGILLEERFVIVNDGDEIRSMTSMPPPVMVTGVYKRILAH